MNVLLIFERAKQGGISQYSNTNRYAKANNKVPTWERDLIKIRFPFNANNLYGSAMSKYLPYGEIQSISMKIEFQKSKTIRKLDTFLK